MVIKDNNPKTDPQGQSDNTTITQKPIDVNSPISLEEAQAVLEAEEGNIEESITKERIEKDKEIAPDLKELKKEQEKKKTEIKEIKEKKEVEAPVEPSKFAGKSETEKLQIYKDMESGFTKQSQRNKELEAKVKELEVVNAKIEEYERNTIINQQKTIPNLPTYPLISLFYDDPEKYHQQVKDYYDAKLNAAMTPVYVKEYNQDKKEVINDLKEKTKNEFVTYAEVEQEVEARLKLNPALFDLHKLGAREFMYNEIKAEMLPSKVEEIGKKAVEKAEKEKELQEESDEMGNTQIMSSDITTLRKESKPVDFAEQLDSGVDPQNIKEAIKKKYHIKNEF